MKLLIHDLQGPLAEALREGLPQDVLEVSDNGSIRYCIGCFGCWVKTPGQCVMKDGYEDMGAKIAACDEVIILSECLYGSYSPFVRNVWDRSLPYILPYFAKREGRVHHKKRYNHYPKLTVHFYGDNTGAERETARRLVRANGINFLSSGEEVRFFASERQAMEEINA